MTATTLPRGDSSTEPAPSPVPPVGAPPATEGRRPAGSPGRALGLGVVGLWLSVIVLLPLAALTVRSFDEGLARTVAWYRLNTQKSA